MFKLKEIIVDMEIKRISMESSIEELSQPETILINHKNYVKSIINNQSTVSKFGAENFEKHAIISNERLLPV